MNSHATKRNQSTKENSLYLPENGIALIEIETKTGMIQPIKVHEISFSHKIYSHRKDFSSEAKAVDKTFISAEQQQKLFKVSQELCLGGIAQTEPFESVASDYFLSIRLISIGKHDTLNCELYLNRRLEKKGKIREIFDQMLSLERAAAQLR